jgi:hypothetical protein
MEKPVEFAEYQGYKNFATWSVIYWIRQQGRETQLQYQRLARTFSHRTFQKDMISAFESFLKGWCPPDSMEASMVRDLLSCGMRAIEWDLVYDLLRGMEIKWVPNLLTVAAIKMISQASWQDVVDNVEFDIEANSRLRDWTRGQIEIWINNVTARQNNAPLSIFAVKIYEVVLLSIDWEEIVKDLRK